MAITPIVLPDEDNITDASHARIGYQQVLTTSETSDADVCLTQNTYERFTSASGTVLRTFTPAGDTEINYIAIAGHNLATAGATLEFLYSLDATVDQVIFSVTPTDNTPIMATFDNITVDEVSFRISGGADREIAHIRAGKTLVMQRPLYGGHSPIALTAKTEYKNNVSDTGQFLGRIIQRKGVQADFSWRHLTNSWYRNYFQPFVEYAKTNAFFIQWRPDYHPNEVAYGYLDKDVKPSNMGGATTLMQVSVSMVGHDEL